MIIPEDIKPEKSLYAIGAEILELFKRQNLNAYDIYVLYDKFLSSMHRDKKISFSYFVYALLWLHLLGLVNLNEEGKILRCS